MGFNLLNQNPKLYHGNPFPFNFYGIFLNYDAKYLLFIFLYSSAKYFNYYSKNTASQLFFFRNLIKFSIKNLRGTFYVHNVKNSINSFPTNKTSLIFRKKTYLNSTVPTNLLNNIHYVYFSFQTKLFCYFLLINSLLLFNRSVLYLFAKYQIQVFYFSIFISFKNFFNIINQYKQIEFAIKLITHLLPGVHAYLKIEYTHYIYFICPLIYLVFINVYISSYFFLYIKLFICLTIIYTFPNIVPILFKSFIEYSLEKLSFSNFKNIKRVYISFQTSYSNRCKNNHLEAHYIYNFIPYTSFEYLNTIAMIYIPWLTNSYLLVLIVIIFLLQYFCPKITLNETSYYCEKSLIILLHKKESKWNDNQTSSNGLLFKYSSSSASTQAQYSTTIPAQFRYKYLITLFLLTRLIFPFLREKGCKIAKIFMVLKLQGNCWNKILFLPIVDLLKITTLYILSISHAFTLSNCFKSIIPSILTTTMVFFLCWNTVYISWFENGQLNLIFNLSIELVFPSSIKNFSDISKSNNLYNLFATILIQFILHVYPFCYFYPLLEVLEVIYFITRLHNNYINPIRLLIEYSLLTYSLLQHYTKCLINTVYILIKDKSKFKYCMFSFRRSIANLLKLKSSNQIKQAFKSKSKSNYFHLSIYYYKFYCVLLQSAFTRRLYAHFSFKQVSLGVYHSYIINQLTDEIISTIVLYLNPSAYIIPKIQINTTQIVSIGDIIFMTIQPYETGKSYAGTPIQNLITTVNMEFIKYKKLFLPQSRFKINSIASRNNYLQHSLHKYFNPSGLHVLSGFCSSSDPALGISAYCFLAPVKFWPISFNFILILDYFLNKLIDYGKQ